MRPKSKTSRKRNKTSKIINYLKFILRLLTNKTIASVIIICSLVTWVYYSGEYDRFIKTVDYYQNNITRTLGITIKDILLSGEVNTSSSDILDVINNPDIYYEPVIDNSSIFNINLLQAKKELEKLPWVHYASVERQYPSTLSVNIIEYKPLALWQNKGNIHLINEEGQIIKENNIKKFSNLIIMVGDDVPTYAANLIRTINNQPELAAMVSSATRISNRRWDITLLNGVKIKLPEKNADQAWDYLAKTDEETGILDSGAKQIDLRVDNKMFVR